MAWAIFKKVDDFKGQVCLEKWEPNLKPALEGSQLARLRLIQLEAQKPRLDLILSKIYSALIYSILNAGI